MRPSRGVRPTLSGSSPSDHPALRMKLPPSSLGRVMSSIFYRGRCAGGCVFDHPIPENDRRRNLLRADPFALLRGRAKPRAVFDSRPPRLGLQRGASTIAPWETGIEEWIPQVPVSGVGTVQLPILTHFLGQIWSRVLAGMRVQVSCSIKCVNIFPRVVL